MAYEQFFIMSVCRRQNFFLGVNGSNQVVMLSNEIGDQIYWKAVPWVSPPLWRRGTLLINVRCNLALRFMGDRQLVGLVPPDQVDANATWTFGGGTDYGSAAVRPSSNEAMNLSIYGGCDDANTQMYTTGWSGDPSQAWQFRPRVDGPEISQYYVINSACLGAPVLAGMTGSRVVKQFRFNGPTPSQQWGFALGIADPIIVGDGRPVGPILINRTGESLACHDNSVLLVGNDFPNTPRGKHNQWVWDPTTPPGHPDKVAIRPLSDQVLNLDIRGGCSKEDNQEVILYSWQGGDANQLWWLSSN